MGLEERKRRMNIASIDEIQEKYRLLFEQFEDDFDRYDYLLELSGELPFMKDGEKTDQLLFQGCQAHIWLKLSMENGRLKMDADSDVILVRGMLFVLRKLVMDRTPQEILWSRLDLFDLPVFEGIIPSARQEGMKLLIEEIRNFVEKNDGN